MTRETKIGLIVAGSFLCLVCVVVASKMRHSDDPAKDTTEEQTAPRVAAVKPTQNTNTPEAKKKGDPAPMFPPLENKDDEKKRAGSGPPPLEIPRPVPPRSGFEPPPVEIPKPVESPKPVFIPQPTAAPMVESESERQKREMLARNPTAPKLDPIPEPKGVVGDLRFRPLGSNDPLPPPVAPVVQAKDEKSKEKDVPQKLMFPPPQPLSLDGKELAKPSVEPPPNGGAFGTLTPLPEPTKPLIKPDNPLTFPPLPKDPPTATVPFKEKDPPSPGLSFPKDPVFTPPLGLPTPLTKDPIKPGLTPVPSDPLVPIARIPPKELPSTPPITAGKAMPPVRDVNTDLTVCRAGEANFAVLSQRLYGTDKYADALMLYNRDNYKATVNGSVFLANTPALMPGQQVHVAPVNILERDYRPYIRASVSMVPTIPPSATPTSPLAKPTPLAPGIATISNPPGAQARTYTVQSPNGESILDIAERVLGDRSQWHKIWRVNPTYQPQFRIPAGTKLEIPAS